MNESCSVGPSSSGSSISLSSSYLSSRKVICTESRLESDEVKGYLKTSEDNAQPDGTMTDGRCASSDKPTKAEAHSETTTAQQQQQPSSGCSSATDNRSSSSNSTTTTATSTSTSASASRVGTANFSRSRAGSSTTSMSKFKEKRPEPLKLNQANHRHSNKHNNNQETPLDLSVKSAGFVPSGFLGSLVFNTLTNVNSAAAGTASAAAAATTTGHMTTLETPRIVWQDNDALLVKQRHFSSSTSANSHKLRISSLAGDSPPMTPGTPLMTDGATAISSPNSMMDYSSGSQTSAGQQLNRHGFLSPLFTRHHSSHHGHHLPPNKPLSASYALSRNSSHQSLQSALMSAHLQYNKQQQLAAGMQRLSSTSSMAATEDLQNQHQYQAMLNAVSAAAAAAAASELPSPFHLELQTLPGSCVEAYLRAPRRSCSTENLTSSLVATNRNPHISSSSSASNHQYYDFPHSHSHQRQHYQRGAPGHRCSHQTKPQRHGVEEKNKDRHHNSDNSDQKDQQHQSNRFSYSGQQIAAATAELGKSQSPIINVIEGSPSSSSNDDTHDSNCNGRQPVTSSGTTKALTPTSVTNATANLLNIRLNSPTSSSLTTTTTTDQQQKDQQPMMDDPLISAAYCREHRGSSWSSSNDLRSINSSFVMTTPTATTTSGTSLSSVSTTLNTPTLISPSNFKACFLPSPTLSPMSSVFELPSPLLMFPPPSATVTATVTTTATSTPPVSLASPSAAGKTGSNCNRLQARNQQSGSQQTKIMSSPALARHGEEDQSMSNPGQFNDTMGHAAGEASSDGVKARACSELALSDSTQTQVDSRSEAFRHFGASSEGSLAHLITCARDKLGRSTDNDDDGDEHGDANVDDDIEDQDENMEIDLQQEQQPELAPHRACQQEQAIRPATTIPRILVSDSYLIQQQQLAGNGWMPSSRNVEATFVAVDQDRSLSRRPISRRAQSPQSLRAQINIYHKERLESSSAPPDVYQGRARPRLKSVTGGSAVDFHHANSCYPNCPTTIANGGALVTLPSNQNRPAQQQQSNNNYQLVNQHYHNKLSAATATATSHGSHLSQPDWVAGQGLSGGSGRQLSMGRPSSADPPTTLVRSSATLCHQSGREYLPVAAENQQPLHYGPNLMETSQTDGGFSQSVQQLQDYTNVSGHIDSFSQVERAQHLQSMSASELHSSQPIHQMQQSIASGIVGGSNQRPRAATEAGSLFQTICTTTLMTGSNQSMAGHHHNQPIQQYHHQNQSKRSDGSIASGMSLPRDHSHSMGELDTLLHHPMPTMGGQANQSSISQQRQHQPIESVAPGQQQQQQQRATSACSLSLNPSCSPVSSSDHRQHNYLHQHQQQRQQQQQQHHNHQHHPQIENFAGTVMPAPNTSFRSSLVAGSTVAASQQQQLIVASTATAAAAKKYRCDECSKAFTRSDMLTRHKRLHSGDRPFQCNECKQEFSRSDHLSTHMRTHTGEKPYRCKLCSYSACRKDMITRHMKVHNRGSPASGGLQSAQRSTESAMATTLISHSSNSDLSNQLHGSSTNLARREDLSCHDLDHR